MALILNVSAVADVNPYTFPAGWQIPTGASTFRVISNALKTTFNVSSTSIAVVTASPTTGFMDVYFTVNYTQAMFSDSAGAAFLTAAGNGYVVEIIDNHIRIKAVTAGVISGTSIDNIAGLIYSSADTFRASYEISTGTMKVYQGATLLLTTNGLTFVSGMKNGIFSQSSNSNAAGIVTANASDTGSSITIDTLDTLLRVGGIHNITTTGLGTLTTATTVGGKAIASAAAPAGDGTITLAGFVAGVAYPAMAASVAVIAGDGTNTSGSVNRQLTTMSGWQYVDVLALNSGAWSLGQAFSGADVPTQFHAINDGTGVLNADGTLTNWALGTYTAWARLTTGLMATFQFIVSQTGVTVSNLITSLPIGSTKISSTKITSKLI